MADLWTDHSDPAEEADDWQAAFDALDDEEPPALSDWRHALAAPDAWGAWQDASGAPAGLERLETALGRISRAVRL